MSVRNRPPREREAMTRVLHLEIERCEQCPYCRANIIGWYCNHLRAVESTLISDDVFRRAPDECPLPDAPERNADE